jgi:hypothetical protein
LPCATPIAYLNHVTPDEYSDVKQLYKFAVARDAFTEISRACEHLIAAGTHSEAPEYYAMIAGIVTLYGRPFGKSALVGKISPSLVPAEFKTLHSAFIELRNKAFAHSDADGQLPGHGKMIEVRLKYDGTGVKSFSSRPVFYPMLLPDIKALCDILAQKVKERHDNFLDRILKVIVPQFTEADIGKEFELNIEDAKGDMVVMAKEPIEHKYPIVRQLPDDE